MARAFGQPRAAAAQQVDRRRLSAGLDLQDSDGAGGAGIQGDRPVDAPALLGLPRARQHQVPLLAEGRPWLDQRRRGDRPVVRLLLLRSRPQGRHRPHRRRRRPTWLRSRERPRVARRVRRNPAQPLVEAGEARQALAARRHLQPRHRPGLHERHAPAARHHDGAHRQWRLRGTAQPLAGIGHAARGAGATSAARQSYGPLDALQPAECRLCP